MKKFLTLFVMLAAFWSCIYDFDAPVVGDGQGLVIEGDIIIGDISTIRYDVVSPMNGTKPQVPNCEIVIEDDRGTVYKAFARDGKASLIDMKEAPRDRRYRVHVYVRGGEEGLFDPEYASPLRDPQPAPVIDDINMTPVGDMLDFELSMHAPEGASGCYRWDYETDWKYHSIFFANFIFNESLGRVEDISATPSLNPYYYCYKHDASSEVGLAIAKTLQGQELSGHKFLSISRSSDAASMRYSVLLKARTISEDCYAYLNNIRENSNMVGSLTTTIPSSMNGNVRSLSDSTHYAVGFVEVSQLAVTRRFFDVALYYYTPKKPDNLLFVPELSETAPDYQTWYYRGYLPVDDNSEDGSVRWGPARCVDCRRSGGTTEVPDFWKE